MPVTAAVVGIGATAASTGYSLSQGSPDYAGQAAAQQAARNKQIATGTTAIDNAFSGFTPDFFKGVQQSYTDYATPQLAQQYQSTKNQIGFGLANRGSTKSGAANTAWNDLGNSMATAKENVVDTGINQANTLQSNINSAKQSEINTLQQTADPAGAAASATSIAAGFATPSTFQPLQDQFTGLLNQYYSSQLLNNYRPGGTGVAAAGYQPPVSSTNDGQPSYISQHG